MIDVETLVFDLDGTLVDSLMDIAQSANFTMQKMGLNSLPVDTIRSFVGDGIRVLLERALSTQCRADADVVDRALQWYVEHHEKHCLDNVRLFDGVRSTLGYFSSKKMAVISNKAERFTKRILQGLEIDQYFQIVMGGDSLPVKKPDPAVLRRVLAETATKPSDALMVGDGPQDIECARAAGVRSCGITSGFRPRSELTGADFVIHSLDELRSIVRC